MNDIKKLFLVICFQSLGSPYLLAHQHCIHPIEEEKAEFYFINLPLNTCIESRELNPFHIGGVSPEYLCERRTGRLTRKKVEELLLQKETPSIICNVIKGRFSQCNTSWGGKISYFNHGKDGDGSPWVEIWGIVDKKNRIVEFTKDYYSLLPTFKWNRAFPASGGSGNVRVGCGKIPINKFIPYSSASYEHKKVFFVDGVKGYFSMRRNMYVKFGPEIKYRSKSADF